MADYFTHFSCVLDVGTAIKAIAALDLYVRVRGEDEAWDHPEFSGFALSLQDGPGSTVLWFHDDGQGDVEGVTPLIGVPQDVVQLAARDVCAYEARVDGDGALVRRQRRFG